MADVPSGPSFDSTPHYANLKKIILLLPTVLWHKIMQKYFKCYKQEWFYNADLLCKEAGNNFYSMHQNYKKKLKIRV
jgi:hypothetical protein